MATLTNLIYLDGMDIWATFGLFIEKGSANLLAIPPRKAGIEHDWKDQDGVEMDLTYIFFDKRDIALSCAIVTDSEADFWTKHDMLIQQFRKPGLHRLSITAHGGRNYYIAYKEANSYTQVKALRNDPLNRVAARFVLVVTEPEPSAGSNNLPIIIVDEQGRLLCT